MTTPTFLVTGATDGIGKATALALARQGASVIIHGRNAAKLAATLSELREATGNPALHTVQADFASLAETAALAEQVRLEYPPLSVLINNAGLLTDHRQTSVDGFELTFAVNHLAPFLLTLNLLRTLRANAPAPSERPLALTPVVRFARDTKLSAATAPGVNSASCARKSLNPLVCCAMKALSVSPSQSSTWSMAE